MAHRTAAGNAAAVGNAAAAGTAAAADTAAAAVAAGRSCQTAAAAAAAQRKTFSNRAKRSCFAAQSPCHAARSRPPAQSPCHAARCVGASAPSVSSLAAPMISTRAGGRRARKGLLRRARRGSAAAQTCICETGAAGGGTSPGGKVPSPLDIFPYSPPSAPGPQATHTLDHTIEERFVQRVRGCQSLRNPRPLHRRRASLCSTGRCLRFFGRVPRSTKRYAEGCKGGGRPGGGGQCANE